MPQYTRNSVSTHKLVAEEAAGTHWPPLRAQRKCNCNWWWRFIKRHFSPFWGQTDPDSMQGKSIGSTALKKFWFLILIFFFLFTASSGFRRKSWNSCTLCTPVDMQWCYMANEHGCYFGINAYYWWRTQQWLMYYHWKQNVDHLLEWTSIVDPLAATSGLSGPRPELIYGLQTQNKLLWV